MAQVKNGFKIQGKEVLQFGIPNCSGYSVFQSVSNSSFYAVVSTRRGTPQELCSTINDRFVVTSDYGNRISFSQAELQTIYRNGLESVKSEPQVSIKDDEVRFHLFSESFDLIKENVLRSEVIGALEKDYWEEGRYFLIPVSSVIPILVETKLVIS